MHEAFGWHMRAGAWANYRDIRAARTSWQHARRIADGLATDPATTSMRITSRALLCATAWRVGGNLVDTGFDDLRELCATAGDTASLALGTAGQLLALTLHHRYRESSRLAAEYAGLIERIDDPTMRVRVLPQVIVAQYEAGAVVEALQLSDRVIDLAEGEAVRQNLVYRTALARATMMRGLCRCALGRAGWRTDLDEAITMARGLDPGSRFLVITYIYGITVANKVLPPDTAVMRGTAEALEIAARSGQDFALVTARWVRGLVLCHGGDPHRAVGLDLLVAARQTTLQQGYPTAAVPVIDIEAARLSVISMVPSRPHGKRSTTSWTTAGCCGTDQQSPFWLKHYSLAVVSRICERRRTPSTDSTECRPIRVRVPCTRAAAVARAAGPCGRRRVRLSRLSGSLPRHGEIAWLRRAYRVGRGDAMTAAGHLNL